MEKLKRILPYIVAIGAGIIVHRYFIPKPSFSGNWVEFITETYVKEAIVKNKTKKVVIFSNQINYSKNDTVNNEAYFIQELTKNLAALDYSYVVIHLPCQEYRCLADFYNVAKYIVNIDPEEVILTAPSSGYNTDILYEELSKANIPILVFGTDVSIFYNKFIGIDNIAVGKMAGQYVNSKISPGDKVFLLHTLKGYKNDINDNGLPRVQAAINELDKATVIESEATRWSKSKSAELTKKAFKKNPDIQWVVAPSYETALGAANALVEMGVLYKVKVLVMDFSFSIAKNLEQGLFDAAVSFDFPAQVADMTTIIVTNDYIFNDKNKPKKLYSGSVITRKDVKYRKKPDGTYQL